MPNNGINHRRLCFRKRRSDPRRWSWPSDKATWGSRSSSSSSMSSIDAADIDFEPSAAGGPSIVGFRRQPQQFASGYRQSYPPSLPICGASPPAYRPFDRQCIPARLREFYSSENVNFPQPPGGWADNWPNLEDIQFPEPLRRDPNRERITGRPGSEYAYRNYQQAMADIQGNRAIRQNFANDAQLQQWNWRLRERRRDPLISPFMPAPVRARASAGAIEMGEMEEEAGPSHGRRQPFRGERGGENPDRYLDWNVQMEPLERARQRLGYLQPPKGKPPQPKGYPRLPGYYEAKSMRDPQRSAGEGKFGYYQGLGQFSPKKIKHDILVRAERAKEFAQSNVRKMGKRVVPLARREWERMREIDWLDLVTPSYYASIGNVQMPIPLVGMYHEGVRPYRPPRPPRGLEDVHLDPNPSSTSMMPKGGDPPTSSQRRRQPASPPRSPLQRRPSTGSLRGTRRRSGNSSPPAPPPMRRPSSG